MKGVLCVFLSGSAIFYRNSIIDIFVSFNQGDNHEAEDRSGRVPMFVFVVCGIPGLTRPGQLLSNA